MLLTTGPDTAEWTVWTTKARLVVSDHAALPEATTLVKGLLDEIDRACSRFRPDSELMRVPVDTPTQVSPLLAKMVGAALDAARRTDGAVDPTVGSAMAALGYDRDLTDIRPSGRMPGGGMPGGGMPGDIPPGGRMPSGRMPSGRMPSGGVPVTVVPGWRSVRLTGNELTLPRGVVLDLGATGKAFAADRAAALVSQLFGVGVLISLGGDIATAGPSRQWRVLVDDEVITLPAGAAIATSSTESRTWRRGNRILHHVLDPFIGMPARRVWRTASVVADHCVDANMLSTAALVRGHDAVGQLHHFGVPARLTTVDGSVRKLGGWA
jgi:thiamine biosynthesis lipoprotein